jgi:uncharacterized protein
MKISISYLPEQKQVELRQISDIILQFCNEIEKIILFGSYARGDYKEDKDLLIEEQEKKKLNRVATAHISDYDILVVTKTKKMALNHSLWNNIKNNNLKKLNLSADPRIITYDIKNLNNKLEKGQYFFSDIKKEGVMLFDNGKTPLAEEKILTDEEIKKIALDDFESWFKKSNSFFIDFNNASDREDFLISAFYLHQAAESALKCILLVFTGYSPKEHYLSSLQDNISQFYPKIYNFFQQNDEESEDRMKNFEYAYIGARYDTKYYILKEDLKILSKEVKKLLEITEEICKNEIES